MQKKVTKICVCAKKVVLLQAEICKFEIVYPKIERIIHKI